MKSIRLALLLPLTLLASCSFKMERPENEIDSARYRVTAVNEQHAILVDTATGETWQMVGAAAWKRCTGGPGE